jgi:tRNA threonylcarbamoyladenosine biosynthesis protein TsaE
LYHFDFYRFDNAAEWEDSGFADYFRPDALCVIEWPERVRGMLPAVDVALSLQYEREGRELMLQAGTRAGNACLSGFASQVR